MNKHYYLIEVEAVDELHALRALHAACQPGNGFVRYIEVFDSQAEEIFDDNDE